MLPVGVVWATMASCGIVQQGEILVSNSFRDVGIDERGTQATSGFQRQEGYPDRVLSRPHPRHGLTSFSANHKPQERNSIVLASVDVLADIDALNRGEGLFDPATGQSWINGRRYGMHSDGKTFPMDGDGVIPVNRGTFRALTILRAYNGATDMAELRMGREKDITTHDRAEALRIWLLREEAMSDDDDWGN